MIRHELQCPPAKLKPRTAERIIIIYRFRKRPTASKQLQKQITAGGNTANLAKSFHSPNENEVELQAVSNIVFNLGTIPAAYDQGQMSQSVTRDYLQIIAPTSANGNNPARQRFRRCRTTINLNLQE